MLHFKQSPSENDPFRLPPHLLLQEKEALFQEKLLQSNALNHTRLASRWYQFFKWCLIVVSGGLFALAFPQYSFDFLAWFGLVPLIWFTLKETPLRALWYGWSWGMGFSLIAFYWMSDIHVMALVALVNILAWFPAIATATIAFGYRYFIANDQTLIDGHQSINIAYLKVGTFRTLLFSIIAACVWVATEYLRTHIFSGLPWNTLATTQWQNLYLLQLCEWTGFYGMSFFIFWVNMGIYYALNSITNYFKLGLKINLRVLVVALILMTFCMLTAASSMSEVAHLSSPRPNETPHKIGVIQGDVPVSWGKPMNDLVGVLNRLTNHTLKLAINDHPEVIIWPETILPLYYKRDINYQNYMKSLIKTTQIPMVIGTADIKEGNIYQNIALLIDKNGEMIDEYAKIHTVPFGEFIPGGKIVDYFFPDLRKKFFVDRDLTPGDSYASLKISRKLQAGFNICFEDVFPYVSRNLTRNGADFLVTITNDAWYPTTDEREQHLANAIFRAIENRRYVVRTGNMARACLIDPVGRIVSWFESNPAMPTQFDGMARGEGGACFTLNLPQTKSFTFYTQYGDLFAQLCSLIALLLLTSTLIRHYHVMSKINRSVTPDAVKIELN